MMPGSGDCFFKCADTYTGYKDSGAWQTMVHTFAKSQTGLKLPSMHIIP